MSRDQEVARRTTRKRVHVSYNESDSEDSAVSAPSDDDFGPSRPKRTGTKRQRTKGAGTGRKPAPAPRAPRLKRKQAQAHDPHVLTRVNRDNPLFISAADPDASHQAAADDWTGQYCADRPTALAQLVTFVLRAAGCNAVVEGHTASDENGIVDALDEIQSAFLRDAVSAVYPLVARPQGRVFRAGLRNVILALFSAAHESDTLYDGHFLPLFEAWVTSLTSSRVRAFRHTATVVALCGIEGLCRVLKDVENTLRLTSAARDTELKRARAGARREELDAKLAAYSAYRDAAQESVRHLFDGVFVHRYRDADAGIRAECIAGLGAWMRALPAFWLEGNYLRYIGWVLTDENKQVRQDALRSLVALYSHDANIVHMQHFTHRFREQLVHMACGEEDATLRVYALQALFYIDRNSLLDDLPAARASVARLIYERNDRVRAAAAPFFSGLVSDLVTERLEHIEAASGALAPARREKTEAQLFFKCFAERLVEFGDAAREGGGGGSGGDTSHGESRDLLCSSPHPPPPVLSALMQAGPPPQGRLSHVVASVWDDDVLCIVQDWSALLRFLLLDHSDVVSEQKEWGGRAEAATLEASHQGEEEGGGDSRSESPGRKQKGAQEDNTHRGSLRPRRAPQPNATPTTAESISHTRLYPQTALSDAEETVLTSVLAASVARTCDDDGETDAGAAIARAFPALLARAQSSAARLADVLRLPQHFDLDGYAARPEELRLLWDAVARQLLGSTAPVVLSAAAATLSAFSAVPTVLDAARVALVSALDSALTAVASDTRRFSVALNPDQLATAAHTLARLDALLRGVDVTGEISAELWDALKAIASRGGELSAGDELGVAGRAGAAGSASESIAGTEPSEAITRQSDALPASGNPGTLESMSLAALRAMASTVMWGLRNSDPANDNGSGNDNAGTIQARLSESIRLFEHLALDNSGKTSHAVQKVALALYLDVRLLRTAGSEGDLGGGISTSSGGEGVGGPGSYHEETPNGTPTSLPGLAPQTQARFAGIIQAELEAFAEKPRSAVELDELLAAVAPFVRALHFGLVELSHSHVLYEHFGAVDPVLDRLLRLLAADLHAGVCGDDTVAVSRVVSETLGALVERGAYDRMHGVARLFLSHALQPRGKGLLILGTLPSAVVRGIHSELIPRIFAARTFRSLRALMLLLVGLSGRDCERLAEVVREEVARVGDGQAGIPDEELDAMRQHALAYYTKLVTLAAKDSVALPPLGDDSERGSDSDSNGSDHENENDDSDANSDNLLEPGDELVHID